ncbi:MAG: zinc ribbon domain-containing protein [Candidatus Omnitrophica bacterium]|nr:zinc ribbon domain-containing protein [Candidatus Omnitrophota bacterium]
MPTYEYQCQKCKHKFEVFQRITEQPLKNCPVCQGKLKRLISAGAGFIFKGPGFYATDYRSQEYKKRQDQENKTGAGSCPAAKDSGACKQCPANKDDKKSH